MLRCHACSTVRSTHKFTAQMLRTSTALLFALGLAATPAGAQFFQFGQPPQQPYQQYPQQYPPRPPAPAQPKPLLPPQARPQAPGAPQSAAPVPPQVLAAPYDHDLARLAEILGALHFLRGLCGSNEGPKWRNEAQTLIEAEAPTGDRHDQMVASFNRGYRGFQQSYRSCTPAAGVVIRRYLQEGAHIAREITARYAN
jgi:uncharacterized protein (TIGR02301 family)